MERVASEAGRKNSLAWLCDAELRKRLLAKNDSSTRVEELEREKFSLEVKLKEIAEQNPGVAVLPTQP